MDMVQHTIETLLRSHFHPAHLTVLDDSAQHAGHAEAKKSGGGHFTVVIVSDLFLGKTKIERHRMVYESLGSLMSSAIHALAIKALTQKEWEKASKSP